MRPSVLQWIRYAYTGRAPDTSAEWVLHDVTCRTWLLRHIARFLLILLPVATVVVAFLPASLPFRLGCVVVGILGSVVFSFGYTVEGAESRAEKAGYAFGVAAPIREQRAQDAQRATAARLRAKAAARRGSGDRAVRGR